MAQTDRIDGFTASEAIKAPVKAVATSNITLSGEQTIASVLCEEDDRVLCTGQTDPIENGIYVVQTGSWYRAKDFEGNRDVRKGTIVTQEDVTGSYRVTSNNPVRIGTDAINWAAVAGIFTQNSGIVSLTDYGGVGDDSTENASALSSAINANIAVYIPPGTFKISDPVVITGTRKRIWGDGRLKFYDDGCIQVGDGSNNASYCELKDFKVLQDSGGTESPIQLINSTRPIIDNVELAFVYRNAITIGGATTMPAGVRIRHVETTLSADAFGIYIDQPGSTAGSVYIEDSRFSGFASSTKAGIRVETAGTLDGFHVTGSVFVSDHDNGIWLQIDSGGTLTNCLIGNGALIDQVDQLAIYVSNGGTIGDIQIQNAILNGTVGTISGTNALVEFAGTGSWTSMVSVEGCDFKNAARHGVRMASGLVGGNFTVKDNDFHDYARDGNSAGAAVSYDGTLDYLEITGNRFDTTRTRDYDIRDDTATVTKLVVHSNSNMGSAPTLGQTSGDKSYNKGVATLLNGNTSVNVTHDLAATPTDGDIMVTPKESLGTATEFRVTAYSSTTFTITVDANPGQDVDFLWTGDVREV